MYAYIFYLFFMFYKSYVVSYVVLQIICWPFNITHSHLSISQSVNQSKLYCHLAVPTKVVQQSETSFLRDPITQTQ